jgi:hypothetical protein
MFAPGYEFPSPSRARSHAASLDPTAPSGPGATCYGSRPVSHMAHRARSPPIANFISWEAPHCQDRRRSDCGESVRRAMTWPNLSFAPQQQLTGPHRPLLDTDAAAVSGGGCSHRPATTPSLPSHHGGGRGFQGRISEGGGVQGGGDSGFELEGGGGGGDEMGSDSEQLRSGPPSAGVQGAAAGGDSGGDGAAAGRRRRSTLCREQAMAIYAMRATDDGGDGAAGRSGCSADAVARQFGVTSKTIRDIWKGRTWFRDTFLLDAGGRAALLTDRFARRPGRPKGSKDTKPRRPKRRLHSPPPASAPSYAHAPPAAAAHPAHAAPWAGGDAAGGYGGAGGAGGWGPPVVTPAMRAVDRPCEPAPPAETCAGDGGRAEGITAAAAGPGEAESDLADPFHHDWAYWPK